MFNSRKKQIYFILSATILLAILLWLKLFSVSPKRIAKPYSDLKTLQKIGRIRIGILQNNTDYYIDNGHVKGFQYELAELMSAELNLVPHYVVYNNFCDNFFALLNNEVDVLAMNLIPTPAGKRFLRYTLPHSFSEHVLVQRKKDLYINEKQEFMLNEDSLSDKKIVLNTTAFSTCYSDALNLSYKYNNEIITLKSNNSYDINSLFNKLDTGSIDLFILDAKTVKSNALLYPNLDYSVRLTQPMPQSWAVHPKNKTLCNAIDKWLNGFVGSNVYNQLQQRYFSEQSNNRQHLAHQHRKKLTDRISRYDDLVKRYAEKKGLDWRFVSAIIFQESKFDPTVTGAGGAHGLMQIMPVTAAHLSMNLEESPEKQIENGCILIATIVEKYKEFYKKENDLLKIVLVAYNTGSGNVEAVRNLAKQKGLNPNCWEDIEYVLDNVSNKSFVQGKTGIKGKIALEYVYKVWRHYAHYKNLHGKDL